MTVGALDGNGVWLYGEDDQRDTFSALLNIGQDSTSDAIGNDRARLAVLEATAALGPTTSGFLTAATGWTIGAQAARKKSGLAFIQFAATRTGAALTPPATGDLANTPVATLNPGWLPASGMYFPLTPLDGRPVFGGIAATDIRITVSAPGITIATNDIITLLGVYPLG